MAHYDLREFLVALALAGELERVEKEVDPELEAAAIAQRLAEHGGPAVHLLNLRGHPGVSLAGATLSRGVMSPWSRTAIALDLEPTSSYQQLLGEVVKRVDDPIRPLRVTGGLVKEVVLRGDEIDLASLPAPAVLGRGRGRCLTSWAIATASEPENGDLTWDLLPMTLLGRNRLTGPIPDDSPIARLLRAAYMPAGRSMPLAVVIGAVPVATMAAGMTLAQDGASPAAIAGALQREPLHVVRAEESDLLVPASAEVVLEGVLRLERRDATPGASASDRLPDRHGATPVFEVTTITRRREPILTYSAWGTPIGDVHVVRGLDADVHIRRSFDRRLQERVLAGWTSAYPRSPGGRSAGW